MAEVFAGTELVSKKSVQNTDGAIGVSEYLSLIPGPSAQKLKDMLSKTSSFPWAGQATPSTTLNYQFKSPSNAISPGQIQMQKEISQKHEFTAPLSLDQLTGASSGLFAQPPAKKAKTLPFGLTFSYT